MAKFKVGDKVQYIRGEKLQGNHQFGVIYTVSEIDRDYINFVEDPTIVLAKRLTRVVVNKFRAGQTVVCIDAEMLGPKLRLTEGKRYGVHSVSAISERVCIVDDRGTRRLYDPHRFMDADAYAFKKVQDELQRFEPGELIPVPRGMVAGQMIFQAVPQQIAKKPRSVKIDPVDAKVALTKMLKEVYGIDATVEQVIGSMDKSLELVLAA